MTEWKSYFARVRAATGHFLLGGQIEAVSSRFEKREHAVRWAEVTRETNEGARRPVSVVVIAASEREPEITADQVAS